MTQSQICQILLNQLSLYGLNPTEWLVLRQAEIEQVVLCHKQDPDFKLIGSFKRDALGFWRIGALTLQSL